MPSKLQDWLHRLIRYIDVSDYIRICWILRVPVVMSEVLLTCHPPMSGKIQLQLWKHLLLKNESNEASLLPSPSLSVVDIELYKRFRASTASFANVASAGVFGEIMRDTMRTFPWHPFFSGGRGPGEVMLGRILRVFAIVHEDVGYCQGMNFIAGVMILARLPKKYTRHWPANVVEDIDGPSEAVLTDENQATFSEDDHIDLESEECVQIEHQVFDLMRILANKHGKLAMTGLWQSGVPRMKLRVFQVDRILRWTLPKLHAHFITIQMAPEVLVAQWFITLFSYTMPVSRTMQIWDYIFLEGWPGVFKVVFSLLKLLEPTMLATDLEGMGKLMRHWKKTVATICNDHEVIIRKAQQLIINLEVLNKLQESFALEMISASEATLGDPGSILSCDTREGLSSPSLSTSVPKESWLARYGNRNLSDEIATDMLRVRDDLISMEAQIDVDKKLIQTKLLRACDAHRDAQTRFDSALQEQMRYITEVSQYTAELEVAMHHARMLAESTQTLMADQIDSDGTHRSAIEETTNAVHDKVENDEEEVSFWVNSPSERPGSCDAHDMSLLVNAMVQSAHVDVSSQTMEKEHEEEVEVIFDSKAPRSTEDNQLPMATFSNSEGIEESPESLSNVQRQSPLAPAVKSGGYFSSLIDRAVGTVQELGEAASVRRRSSSGFAATSFAVPGTGISNPFPFLNSSAITTEKYQESSSIPLTSSPIQSSNGAAAASSLRSAAQASGLVLKGPSASSTNIAIPPPQQTRQGLFRFGSRRRDNKCADESKRLSSSQADNEAPDLQRPTEKIAKMEQHSFGIKEISSSSGDRLGISSTDEKEVASSPTSSRPILGIFRSQSVNVSSFPHFSSTPSTSRGSRERSQSHDVNQHHGEESLNGPSVAQSLGGAFRGGVGKVFQLASNLRQQVAPTSPGTDAQILQGSWLSGIYHRGEHQHVTYFAEQSRLYQRKIIDISRELEISKQKLAEATKELHLAKQMEEDMTEWKKSLCDQLQRLVEDANRGRSQKLQYLSDTYQL